ncbi:MAG: hypothetical protein H7243_00545 [Sphingomonadaceae bacterium]|nr:hypothetical protein [Sphingomonadaceae bacterium]
MLPILIALAAIALPSGILTPTPAALESGLAGRWRGALGYRDYQSNKLEELPVETEIRAVGDGVSVVRIAKFDDGPKTGTVTITTAALYDDKAGTVSEVSLRKGRPVEVATEHVAVTARIDATHWTLSYTEDGQDNDAPARLRITETLTGDTLLSVKEVLPATATDGVWRFRNQTRLARLP